jgi:hypothetical protein
MHVHIAFQYSGRFRAATVTVLTNEDMQPLFRTGLCPLNFSHHLCDNTQKGKRG